MKNILFVVITALLMAAGLSSCTNYQNPVEPVFIPGDSVRFANDILPIFNARCNNAGCHASGGIQPDLSPANAYNNLITFGYVDTDAAEQSIIYLELNSGSMKTFADANDAPKLLEWIKQGAQNN